MNLKKAITKRLKSLYIVNRAFIELAPLTFVAAIFNYPKRISYKAPKVDIFTKLTLLWFFGSIESILYGRTDTRGERP